MKKSNNIKSTFARLVGKKVGRLSAKKRATPPPRAVVLESRIPGVHAAAPHRGALAGRRREDAVGPPRGDLGPRGPGLLGAALRLVEL